MPVSQDQLKFIMQRYDTYISGANTKGTFLLAFNTFLCGGVLSNYSSLIEMVGLCLAIYLKLALLLLVICGIVSLFIVLLAVYPFLKSGNSSKDKYHSLIYFGSVSAFKNPEEYIAALGSQNDPDVFADMSKQIHQLAQGLYKKYRQLEWATKIIFAQLSLIIFIMGLIVINSI